MFILIFSLICSQPVNVDAARDTTIQQILEGRWENAITNAKIVLKYKPTDYLLLGLLKFADQEELIELAPKFLFGLMERKSEIIDAWEKFYKENTSNKNILHILTALNLYADTEKTNYYVTQILQLDSLNSYAYSVLGYLRTQNGNYDEAIEHYKKSFQLDTTQINLLSVLAYLYIITSNYDSALGYYRKIPYDDSISNSLHIGEVICELQKGNVLGAETSLAKINDLQTTEQTKTSVEELKKYLDNVKVHNLSPNDSFFVVLSSKTVRSRKVIVLTSENIEIVDCEGYEEKPKPLSIPTPVYPEKARKAGFEGPVIVKALVDIDGSVIKTEIIISSGVKELNEEALKVAKKAQFEPAKRFGKPVKAWVSIPIKFILVER